MSWQLNAIPLPCHSFEVLLLPRYVEVAMVIHALPYHGNCNRVDRTTRRKERQTEARESKFVFSFVRATLLQTAIKCKDKKAQVVAAPKCSYRIRALQKCDAAIVIVAEQSCFFANKCRLMMAFIGGGMRSLVHTVECGHESGVLSNKLARLFDVRLWPPKRTYAIKQTNNK